MGPAAKAQDNNALNRSGEAVPVGLSPDGRRLPLYPTTDFTTSTLSDALVNAGVIQLNSTLKSLPSKLEAIAWDAYHDLISDAERKFGIREACYSVNTIMQDPSGPDMVIDGKSITLVVGPNATQYPPTLISNIAHETIHT
ncbi:hypothetical protein MFFC18_26030 [Mariniblastus fucicola]|uniref:Uncharacterized protein n=1 Tax=Mariniblastus fucicola TaxID=980251 RepID=A0A5B9PCD5_9BACT|nr:hypothetical protein MFFC18_26030 [Mariniblastus fucicola]